MSWLFACETPKKRSRPKSPPKTVLVNPFLFVSSKGSTSPIVSTAPQKVSTVPTISTKPPTLKWLGSDKPLKHLHDVCEGRRKEKIVCLKGPPSSGKSHLLEVYSSKRTKVSIRYVDATDILPSTWEAMVINPLLSRSLGDQRMILVIDNVHALQPSVMRLLSAFIRRCRKENLDMIPLVVTMDDVYVKGLHALRLETIVCKRLPQYLVKQLLPSISNATIREFQCDVRALKIRLDMGSCAKSSDLMTRDLFSEVRSLGRSQKFTWSSDMLPMMWSSFAKPLEQQIVFSDLDILPSVYIESVVRLIPQWHFQSRLSHFADPKFVSERKFNRLFAGRESIRHSRIECVERQLVRDRFKPVPEIRFV
jgi:hypothetical protein